MTNFTGTAPTLNSAFSSTETYGVLRRQLSFRMITATTAANTTSGSVTMQKTGQFTIPSVTSPVTGFILSSCSMQGDDAGAYYICWEKDLGNLAVSGNVFSGGASMPTKTVLGESLTTAAWMPLVVITAALTAITPVLTITYTDQDGNASQTCTMTLPTSPAINSTFLMIPHLANGDTAIRSVSNISISTGSAGTLKVFGCMPLSFTNFQTVNCSLSPLLTPLPPILLEASDAIGFYRGINTGGNVDCTFVAIPELS